MCVRPSRRVVVKCDDTEDGTVLTCLSGSPVNPVGQAAPAPVIRSPSARVAPPGDVFRDCLRPRSQGSEGQRAGPGQDLARSRFGEQMGGWQGATWARCLRNVPALTGKPQGVAPRGSRPAPSLWAPSTPSQTLPSAAARQVLERRLPARDPAGCGGGRRDHLVPLLCHGFLIAPHHVPPPLPGIPPDRFAQGRVPASSEVPRSMWAAVLGRGHKRPRLALGSGGGIP